MKKWKKILLVVIAAIIVIVILLTVKYKIDHTFTVERWDTKIEKRLYMYDDLMEKYNLIGMTRDQILELLGTNGISPGSDIQYIMGGIFYPVILHINFDESGKVISANRIFD